MCTVSFIPKGNDDFVFTSNRDEAISRKTIVPKMYQVDGEKVLCPKDEVAGGTWIGVSGKQRLVCLLNGGFVKHQRKNKYKHSRGKVVNDLLLTNDFRKELAVYDLLNVEPFTLIVLDWSNSLVMYELVWNEKEKHFREMNVNESFIWSSSTLYTEEMRQTRKDWFTSYFTGKPFSQENCLDFHENYGIGDTDLDLQIDRGELKTVSITSVEKTRDAVSMIYKDLLQKEQSLVLFDDSTMAYG